LNKLQDDIKKIPVIPADLNTRWGSVKTKANEVPDLIYDLDGLNRYIVNF
jgi:hypothetical protein